MSNVLGSLFQNIADAIRGKTGETESMKPSEFPDKIAAIETGGSGGNGGGNGLVYTSGTFIATGGEQVVEHGHGRVPDMILCYQVKANVSLSGNKTLLFIGSSKAMYEATGNTSNSLGRVFYILNGGFMNAAVGYSAAIDQAVSFTAVGQAHNCNSETFAVGGGSLTSLASGLEYGWYAISGIT